MSGIDVTFSERFEEIRDGVPALGNISMPDLMGMVMGGGSGPMIDQIRDQVIGPFMELFGELVEAVDDLKAENDSLRSELETIRGVG